MASATKAEFERLFLAPQDDAKPQGLCVLPVPARLRPAVHQLLWYEEQIPPGQEVVERILPDGAVRLIFDFEDGRHGVSTRVAGATAAPVVLRLRGRLRGLSLALRPGAAAAVLGAPAASIAGQVVPLDVLWAQAGRDLAEQILSARGPLQQAAVVLQALHRRLQDADPTAIRQAQQAAQLLAQGSRVRETAEALGCTERRLQQIFHAHVGLAPRTWARLARLHRCLRVLEQGMHMPWAELAVQAGYYDQSHLANEFRALSGLSPGEFLQHRVSGSSKTAP